MKLVIVRDYEWLSKKAAAMVEEEVKNNRLCKLGLATGGTPKRMYELLVESYKASNEQLYKDITTFNLDEYVGLSPEDPNSYYYYMRTHLLNDLDVSVGQMNIPNGIAGDLEEECEKYDKLIEHLGGVDLQILGIGENGHIGFNEPGTSFSQGTHVVTLEPSTLEANARYFSSLEDVPKQAITMGIQTIVKSKQIILLASGHKKAEAIQRLVEGEVTEQFPASILKTHPNVTVIVDEPATKNLKKTDRTALVHC